MYDKLLCTADLLDELSEDTLVAIWKDLGRKIEFYEQLTNVLSTKGLRQTRLLVWDALAQLVGKITALDLVNK